MHESATAEKTSVTCHISCFFQVPIVQMEFSTDHYRF